MGSECAVYSAGIDWLTMTYKPDQSAIYERAVGLCEVLAASKERDGYKTKKGTLRDYTGVWTNQLFWGARADGYIIQASSDTGNYLAGLAFANGCEGKGTRIDCEVTVKFNQDQDELATQIYRNIRQQKQANEWPQNLRLDLTESGGGGDSIYIGSRASERYRRIYDKTREQLGQVEPHLWRWEVEFKGDTAQEVMKAVHDAGETVQVSQRIIAQEFTRLGLGHEWMQGTTLQKVQATWNPTNNQRRLKWLASQVRPAYQELRQEGLEEQALDAVGFWDDNT